MHDMRYPWFLAWLVIPSLALSAACPAVAGNTPYQTAVIGDGAVVYYPMEDTTSTAVDLGSSHTNGVYSGTLANMFGHSSATTFLGNAVAFNGARDSSITGGWSGRWGDNNISVNNAPFSVGTGSFTVELWYKAAKKTRGDIFNFKDSGSEGKHDMGIILDYDSSDLAYMHYAYGSPSMASGMVADSQDSNWHYLVTTRDGSNGAVRIYRDGNSTPIVTTTDICPLVGNASVLIGSNHSDAYPTFSFDGYMDEFAFYNTVLTQAQIQQHYQLANGVPEPTTLIMLAGSILTFAAYRFTRREPRKV
jgi:hypothetical protein